MAGAAPRFGVHSDLGITNQIQSCTNLSQGWWLALTNVVVAQSPYWFSDVAAAPESQRFYRVRVVGPTPSGMALILASSFTMGNGMDPAEGDDNELPLHTVYVSAFYMDRYEVTKALWDEVHNWGIMQGYSFENAGKGKAGSHPVQFVDWYDCVTWCNARSQKEGLTPCYYTNASHSELTIYRGGQSDLSNNWVNWAANGYRLPTEAEWEKAARAGLSGHRFPWPDVDTITHSQANYHANPTLYAYDVNLTRDYHPTFSYGSFPYTSPAGYFGVNGYGLYDIAGNVTEWCWDRYSGTYYSSSPGTDPRGPDSGFGRVHKGGSWGEDAVRARCAGRRNSVMPGAASIYDGFRCVRGL
jgi:formylglycine-generating enzyme required for sulfatase activity